MPLFAQRMDVRGRLGEQLSLEQARSRIEEVMRNRPLESSQHNVTTGLDSETAVRMRQFLTARKLGIKPVQVSPSGPDLRKAALLNTVNNAVRTNQIRTKLNGH